ncbi:unnamed protein product [Prorocentrum cordatum]|uniref:Uncharacterized protein n=1 Tax=Prorocentrum cordatum TaxID=2364126 RepID=A0ABN9RY40_9DINO|nr:unnamed protein product [Polarella glacialis]
MVWDTTDTHFGLARQDVASLQRMPIEWVQAVMPVLMRLSLRHEQGLSQLEAASYRHVQLPTKHDVVQSMQLTAKYYGTEAARIRKDKREQLESGQTVDELVALGIPHPHVWMALVGALVAQGEKIGQQNLAALTQYQQKARQERPTNSTLADDIHHCRMQSTHNGEMTKIWIAVDPPTLENTVVSSMADVGSTDPADVGESATQGIPESTSVLDPGYDSVTFRAPDSEET